MTKLLTADEVADRLGVTRDWLWKQVRAGAVPYVKLGTRSYRFREEAIEQWLRDLENGTDAA